MNQTFFLPRDSGLHRLHPLTKMTIAALVMVAAFTLGGVWVALALYVGVVLPLAVWGKILPQVVRTTVTVLLPIGISLALVQGFFYPGATTVIWQIGPFALKQEGLEFALTTISRLIVVAGAGLVLLYSTHPADLALALVQIGAPYALAYIVVTAIQLLPEMQARASEITNAQQARGLVARGKIAARVRALFPLVAPLVYGALEMVQERALALDARAFRAPREKTSWRVLHDTRWQLVLRWGMVIGIVGLVAYAAGRGLGIGD